jgi:hypothetical protein
MTRTQETATARFSSRAWRPGIVIAFMHVAAFGSPVNAAATRTAAPDQPATTALPPGAEPPLVPFAKKPRTARSRNDLPDDILALLPWQGIYAVSGGTISPAWRVVVTLSGDLRAGSNGKPGASTTAVIDKKRRRLDVPTLTEIVTLADRAWREDEGGKKKPKGRDKGNAAPPPAAAKVSANPFVDVDYGEFLIIADGAQIFVLHSQGPITRPAAAALIKRLQSEAAK